MINSKTKLVRFKVQNFRSVDESDWIEISDNSCLIGINEAGKTNLLIALWKLNPVNKEPIIPLDDFPRHLFSKYKAENYSNTVFITADFIIKKSLQEKIASELNCDLEQIKRVCVKRKYNGDYNVSFPYSKIEVFPSERIKFELQNFKHSLTKSEYFIKENNELQETINTFLDNEISKLTYDSINEPIIQRLHSRIETFTKNTFGKKKKLPEAFHSNLLSKLNFFLDAFKGIPISITDEIRRNILRTIPKFVYYSDYGNLDSEIFLPRVIEDFERGDLSESARAKVRTLDVLFKYVNLSPQQIYELGNDRKIIIKTINQYNQEIKSEEQDLSEEEIVEWSERKRERSILLHSAATELTKSFRKWWLQGDYIFNFEADGNHFRINVSDHLRPEPIELEGRSRGLQWFFSFFLVFLVETQEGHTNTVLLLDEPGLSLHPLAQYDLAKFFRKLSEDNQLIYTSHSPFLVDMDNLANVKAVYIDKESGKTKISSNLRYNEKDAEKSIYPVHAALGLTISDTLLLGCKPILVEGPSDQIYLNIIKRCLTGKGKLQYSKEIVFIPTGGVKGVKPIAKLVSSRENELPIVLLDSDGPGKEFQNKLKSTLYKGSEDKVLEVASFISEGRFEIEDLIPHRYIISIIDRKFRADEYFEDVYEEEKPIIDQIDNWAKKHSIQLKKGWKVEMAREIQNRFGKIFETVSENQINIWDALFKQLLK